MTSKERIEAAKKALRKSTPTPTNTRGTPMTGKVNVPEPDTLQKVATGVQEGFSQAGQAAIGTGKSIASTANTVSRFGQQALQKLTSWIPGMPKVNTASLPQNAITPTNQSQAAGFLGGMIGQSFGVPAAPGAAALAKAPALVRVPGQAAFTGASQIGVAKAQGASNNQALLAGGVGAGASLISKPAASFLQQSAEKNYTKVLNPTTKDTRYLTNRVVPELRDRNTFALTRKGLLDKVSKEADVTNELLDHAYDALPQDATTNWKPVLEALQTEKNAVTVNGVVQDVGRYQNLNQIQKQLLQTIGGGVQETKDSIISVDSARQVRKIFDSAIKRKGTQFGITGSEADLVAAQKVASNSIRHQIAQEYPNVGKINKELNFWLNVQDVLRPAVQKAQNAGNLSGDMSLASGSVVGAVTEGTIGAAAKVAVISKLLNATVKSTAWRTGSAVLKNQLADALARGDFNRAGTILSQIQNSTQIPRVRK